MKYIMRAITQRYTKSEKTGDHSREKSFSKSKEE